MSRLVIRWGRGRFVTGWILFACLALGWTSAASASSNVNLVGTWHCCGGGGASSQTWNIKSMAPSGSFRGSGRGGSFTFPITGKVSGHSVTLKTGPYKQDPTYSATFTGKLSKTGKMMSGRWKSTSGQSGSWNSRLKPRPRNAIKVRGPTSNTFHKNFNETVSGFATGPANYVISGEQLYPHGGCAKTYTAEKARSDWYQWPTGTGAVKGKFSLVAKFYARNHKTHGICSYLINSGTQKTYAHASRFWHNS